MEQNMFVNCNSINELKTELSNFIEGKELITASAKVKIESKIQDIEIGIERGDTTWEKSKLSLMTFIYSHFLSETYWYKQYVKE